MRGVCRRAGPKHEQQGGVLAGRVDALSKVRCGMSPYRWIGSGESAVMLEGLGEGTHRRVPISIPWCTPNKPDRENMERNDKSTHTVNDPASET